MNMRTMLLKLAINLENRWTSRFVKDANGNNVERYSVKQRNCAYYAVQVSDALVGYIVTFSENVLGYNMRESIVRTLLETTLSYIHYGAYIVFTNGNFSDLDPEGLLALIDGE